MLVILCDFEQVHGQRLNDHSMLLDSWTEGARMWQVCIFQCVVCKVSVVQICRLPALLLVVEEFLFDVVELFDSFDHLACTRRDTSVLSLASVSFVVLIVFYQRLVHELRVLR